MNFEADVPALQRMGWWSAPKETLPPMRLPFED